jgi:hypothetical protein
VLAYHKLPVQACNEVHISQANYQQTNQGLERIVQRHKVQVAQDILRNFHKLLVFFILSIIALQLVWVYELNKRLSIFVNFGRLS